jgi:transcriptional regulator with PAS, ATPase and Fis domain
MPDEKAMTKEQMEHLLSQQGATLKAMISVVTDHIKKYKLPYKLIDGKLVEVGDSTDAWLSRFVTVNEELLQMKQDVRKLYPIDEDADQLFSVLINGPTGTGKELIALALHGDRVGEFVAINCAGLPSELVESELFGHVRGSFTSASSDKIGLMKAANKGTLFLDEIGELPMPAQAKLLRAIQKKQIRKVGGNQDENISCRIICATHRNLQEMCNSGNFRIDLYSRISTYELKISGLSERHEDIKPIIESIEGGKEFLEAISKTGLLLTGLDLTLNVRSLQQYIKRYKILGKLPV